MADVKVTTFKFDPEELAEWKRLARKKGHSTFVQAVREALRQYLEGKEPVVLIDGVRYTAVHDDLDEIVRDEMGID